MTRNEDPPSGEAGASTEMFGMTDLEEGLQGPDAEAIRDALLRRLDAALDRVGSELARGTPPQSYEPTRRIHDALAVARRLVIQR